MSSTPWAELGISWEELTLTVVTAVGIYAAIIALSRLFGQRRFLRTTSYDLALTFAMGSLVGRVILVSTSLLGAVVGLATMFLLHYGVSWLHHNVLVVHQVIQNRPILLVAHGELLQENLRRVDTSTVEVYEQMRLAGIGRLDEVQAMILERNGGMSLVPQGALMDDVVFTEVVGCKHLALRRH